MLAEPVTLDQAKAFLNVGFDDDNDIITAMITGARELLEREMNISIAPKTLKVTFTHDGCYNYSIPYGPIGDLTEAVYKYDWDDTVDVTTTDYKLIGDEFKQFRGQTGIWAITYTAGYITTPEAIKQGILKQVAWMYENRGDGLGSNQVNQDVLFMLSGFNKNSWI